MSENPGTEHNEAPFQQGTPQDFFGFAATTERFMLPDGISYIEYKPMNEGQKSRFQKLTQRDMILDRKSGNARFKMDPAEERHALIEASVTGWNLTRGGNPLPFTIRNLNDFLTLADPKIIEDLERTLRKANPWLLGEMSSEDIREEIKNLEEMLEIAEKREAGEAS